MSKSQSIAELAERLVRELTFCRENGVGCPLPLEKIANRLDPEPDIASLLKAVKNPAFTTHAIAAFKGSLTSPVALTEDRQILASCPLTLEGALRAKKPTKTGPPWLPSDLKTTVEKSLQAEFLRAVSERLASGDLPAFAVRTQKKKSLAVYHLDFPPPLNPQVLNAERLVEGLRSITPAEGAAPLATLASLASNANVPEAAIAKAIQEKVFTDTVLTFKHGSLGTVAVLRDALLRFATGTPLLDRLLADCYQANIHAHTAKDLVAKLPAPLKNLVTEFLRREDLARHLPANIGFLMAKATRGSQRLFFRLESVQHGSVESIPQPSLEPVTPKELNFSAAFEAAFERLDRERGSYNFVSLVDLREALPHIPRELFDASLQQLRKQQRFWLKSAEGFNGLRPEEKAAAIPEEGELLLHVSKVRP